MTQTVTQPVAVQADYQRIPGNKAVATVQGGQPAGNGGSGPGGEATWGFIVGDIANQADLMLHLDAKVDLVTYQAAVPPHIADLNNPHQVTKAQVGLGNADNTADVNKPMSNPTKTYVDSQIATVTASANNRVLRAGDTMTGVLQLSSSGTIGIGISSSLSPYLNLQKGASGQNVTLASFTGSTLRWQLIPGDNTTEGGANVGSNYVINRFNDAGNSFATGMTLVRSNGYVTFGPGAVRNAVGAPFNGGATLELSKLNATFTSSILGNNNGSTRWALNLGTNTAESGSNAGSDFSMIRYDDAGAPLGVAMLIARKNGQVFIGAGTPRAAALADTSGDVAIEMSKAVAAANNRITGSTNGSLRWSMDLGNTATESGSNAGSNFSLTRFSDAGSALSTAFQINRATGAISMGPGTNFGASGSANSVWLNLNKAGSGNTSVILGTNNGLSRWAIELGSTDAETGGNSGSRFAINVYDDAGAFVTAALRIERNTRSAYFSNRLNAAEGYIIQAGSGVGPGPSVFNFNWTGSLQAWIDTTNVGTVTLTSDERVKQDVVAMPDRHEAFMAIRPKQYRWADVGIFKDDGREYSGWSAQQLLACGFGHAVDGDITALQENGDPQPASVQDRPILAQAVLEIQALHALVAELRAEINALKGQ